jgi:ubiquinone/menaquinone biosynthesis C-methylase UbiE
MTERASKDRASIVFERAIEDYDRTRSLPPEAMEAVLVLLSGELADHQPCLEIGVGTGRMALALAARGLRMAGVDLSPMMLGELRRKAGGRSPFPIARADAVHLPFADASFGAGLAVHVLHLIPAWREALTELARVVRRPGVVLVDTGGPGTGWWPAVEKRFRKEAGISPGGVGLQKGDDVDQYMASLGATARKPDPIEANEQTTIAERIEWLEDGLFSFTWQVDEATRWAAAERCRTWAVGRFGPLDQPITLSSQVVYRAYDLA